MKHLLFYLGMFCFSFSLLAQNQKELKEIVILQKQDTFSLNSLDQQITRKEIQSIPYEDVGVITQKIAGISLKNYGGLGGLKTFSFRGISGNHSVVMLNEFALNNHQVGQIDLGGIQAENIENIRFNSVSDPSFLYPVSSLVAANSLNIQTFENRFSAEKYQLRFNSKYGSYSQLDNYLSLKKGFQNKSVSIYGKRRSFDGAYPFKYMNGENQFDAIRKNNDLLEWNTGIHFSSIKEYKRWNAAYHFYQSEKGLPGSVIFYNDFASQRLFTKNHIVNMERIVCKNNFNSKTYGSYQTSEMRYSDPSYLNNKGELIQNYQNNSLSVGEVFNVNWKDSTLDFFGGGEYQLHTLVSQNTTLVYNPKRHIGMFVFGAKIDKKGYLYHLQLNNHQVLTHKIGGFSEYQSIFSGNIFVEKKSVINVIGLPRLQFKRTMRLPTFGELFINTIYEKELKPELVNQLDLGTSMYLKKFKFGIDVYANLIENKIVAIPTKNLFLWSVQNVGKVFTQGADLSIERNFLNESTISIKTKGIYSFQSALDYSSKTSPSYKQQIAYIPKHTGILDLNVEFYKKVSFNWSTTILSSRYALNENINSNLVSGFTLSDVSIAYSFKTKKQSEFKCNFSVKNLFNASYQYIRYYVMPGRNYLISLSYAFQ